MPLVVYGYDLICFAIVASAICGSIWAIQRQECRRCSNESKYESLLADGSDGELFVGPTQMGHVGSSLLWMSCWRGVHPAWLLALRALSGIVMAGFLIWDITRYGSSIFVYYTEWTFTLVIIYFGLGTIVSAHGCWMYSKYNMENEEKGGGSWKTDTKDGISAATSYETVTVRSTIKLQSDCNKEMIKQRAGFWGYLMQIVYQTSAGAMMLTNIVFWCLIVPFLSIKHFSLNLLMGCMHTLNAVFLLLDTALNSMTFPSFRLAYFVLWSCIYIIFQWVLHMCGFSWLFTPENFPLLEASLPQKLKLIGNRPAMNIEPQLSLSLSLSVALPFSGALHSLGTFVVPLLGSDPHPLLWFICPYCRCKKFNFLKTVPTYIHKSHINVLI